MRHDLTAARKLLAFGKKASSKPLLTAVAQWILSVAHAERGSSAKMLRAL